VPQRNDQTPNHADLAPKSRPQVAPEPIFARFLASAAEQPNAVALTFEAGRFTYGELERNSRALALELKARGAVAGDRVAILAERGPELVWSILAVARLGAVFVVLDSAYPAARLEALAAIARPAVIVKAGGAALDERARTLAEAAGAPWLDAAVAPGAGPLPALAEVVDPREAAYFLFTSGSTGQPKGVACAHQPLVHFVGWHARTFDLSAADVFTLLSGLSHDPVLRDIFTPLSLGATLAIPPQSVIAEPGALARWFRAAGASVAHLTPAMGHLLAATGRRNVTLPKLRRLFWGGDQLTTAHIHGVARLAPQAEHVNFYGCTETPQAVAFHHCTGTDAGAIVPIGQAVDGFELLVVGGRRRPLGAGVPGQVAVRSPHLSLGYVKDGQVIEPDDRRNDTYFTGDRGVRRPDGALLLLGREDDQVSVRGYRVDLSEITAALMRHSQLRNAAVLPRPRGDAVEIVAFVEGDGIRPGQIETFLTAELPAYMQPREIVVLDRMPLSANGKLDRQALLAELETAAPQPGPTSGVPNDAQARLIAAWSHLFGRPVTPDATYVSLGGDSLTYVNAYLAAEEILGELPEGWDRLAVADLAGAAPQPATAVRAIDTPMLIRAAAIVAVVAGHVFHSAASVGATTALMLVSGLLFGGFGLRKAFDQASAKPILNTFLNLLVPVAAASALFFLYGLLRHHSASLPLLFLSADLVDYRRLPAELMHFTPVHLWYVHALLKILLAVWLAFELVRRLSGGRPPSPLAFAAGLFAIGCALRFAAPIFVFGDFLSAGAQDLSPSSYAASAHLATFALGAVFAFARTSAERAFALVALAGFALLTASFYGVADSLAALACGAAFLWAPRVKVPKAVATLALALSGASLCIYLFHIQIADLADRVSPIPGRLDALAAGLAAGVVLWKLSLWAAARARRSPLRNLLAGLSERGARARAAA
jgi:amino acid adenylation domain-containing protein